MDDKALIEAEGAAKLARQGKLGDDLYGLSLTTSSETVPVWIWADFRDDTPPKEALIRDASARRTYEAQANAKLQAVTSKVTGWLDSRGYKSYARGVLNPSISAEVPVAALRELGQLDGVAAAGLRTPTVLASAVWFDTIKMTAAHAIVSSASGQAFCNTEGYQPDNYTYLSVSSGALYSSLTPGSQHTRFTTELIAATAGNRVAPDAIVNIGDWGTTNDGVFSGWEWCLGTQGVDNVNISAIFDGLSTGGLTAADWGLDYYVKHYPYPAVAQAAGNCNDGDCSADCSTLTDKTVGARGRNILVVGGSSANGTTSTSDDTMATFSPYVNPQTSHGDFELPNIVAPALNIDSKSESDWCGTSGAAPQVLGTALLLKAVDSSFTSWPEMVRATLLATATHPVDSSRTTIIGSADLKQGAGLLNANAAVTLAAPANHMAPNSAYVSSGRYGKTYTFSTDFASGISNDAYDIYITNTGRLRAVAAWDGTASGCSSTDGSGCTGEALDADLDLAVFKWNAGTGTWSLACDSDSFDSSWELCDLAVNSGEYYKAQLILNATNATSTYLGMAWQNYLTSSE